MAAGGDVIRPQQWGGWPREERRAVVLTRDELMALPVRMVGANTHDLPDGAHFLVHDRFDWPRRYLLLRATVIRGAFRYGGAGAGDRLACDEHGPRRELTGRGSGDAIGYELVHTECPALDALLARGAK